MRKKFFTISISSLSFVFFAFIVLVLLVIGYAMHPNKIELLETPKDYNLTYEDITFHNMVDNTELQGWWIPSQDDFFEEKRSKDTIIFAHGFGGNRTKMPVKSLKIAKKLAFEGYNVLMFDFRNSGNSGGDMTTIGYYEKYDILSAVEFAKSRESNNIGLLGWSMGASSSILAASDSDDVKAVIADSPFSDFNSYMGEQFSYWTKLPNKLSPLVVNAAETFIGLDYSKVSPKSVAKEIQNTNTAMLLIHGDSDHAISYQNSLEIKKKNPDAELWLIKDAGHIGGHKVEKAKYEEKVIEFFNKHMRKKSMPNWHAFSLFHICSCLIKHTLLWHFNFFIKQFLSNDFFCFLYGC